MTTPRRRRQPRPGSEGPPIKPTLNSAYVYEREIRREVLDPFVRRMQYRLDQAGRNYQALREAIRAIPDDPSLQGLSDDLAGVQAEKLKAKHTAEFTRKMSRYLGVNVGPMMSDLGLENVMRQYIADNVDLIKTIPQRYHAALVRDLAQLATDAPFDQQELTRMLRKTYKSSGYNVRRLSRDQTNKLIGQFNGARQQQIGIAEYVWQTSEDERVRPTHVIKNGQTFRWDSPPPDTGHPGQDIQCRCVAIPVMPDVPIRPAAPPR